MNNNYPNHARADLALNLPKSVNFFCAAPRARHVELEGDFNNWVPSPMIQSVDGWWVAEVEMRRGHHLYRFLLDGQPMLDLSGQPAVRNENGEMVSLIEVS